MRVGGFTPLSTRDWPDHVAATVFCQGCPLRCGYCHNPELQPVTTSPTHTWTEVLTFLRTRRGLLDGVVFSGGEPTLQPALEHAVADVRQAGFTVGVHTSGVHPRRLRRLLPALDWVGLDVKAPPRLYRQVSGSGSAATAALHSLRVVLHSGVPLEVRITLHPALDPAALRELADLLAAEDVTDVALQARRHVDSGAVLQRPGDLPGPVVQHFSDRFPGVVLRE